MTVQDDCELGLKEETRGADSKLTRGSFVPATPLSPYADLAKMKRIETCSKLDRSQLLQKANFPYVLETLRVIQRSIYIEEENLALPIIFT